MSTTAAQEEPYIGVRGLTLSDVAKKLNLREREFLVDLRKQDYKDGFQNCFKMLKNNNHKTKPQ